MAAPQENPLEMDGRKFQPDATSPYNQPVVLSVTTVMMVLTVVVVGLRFWTRRWSNTRYGMDDWTILASLVMALGTGVICLVAAAVGGLGEHLPLGPEGHLEHNSTLTNFEKCRYSIIILSTANLGVVKVSVILFYRRLFSVRPFKIVSNVAIAVVTLYTVIMTSAMLAQCNPVHLFWDVFELEYGDRCLSVQVWYIALAWSDMALDLIVLLLPIPTVMMLKMPWRRKIGVLDILLLGAVVLGSGIGRLVSFIQVINAAGSDPFTFLFDTTWWTSGPLFWAFAEGSVAIIGACLPCLAPLWTQKQNPSASKAGYYGSSGASYGHASYGKSGISSRGDPRSDLSYSGRPEPHSSARNLVGSVDIRGDVIPLESRGAMPHGIAVQREFGSNRV